MKGKEKQMQRLSGANCKCRLSGVIGTWSTMHWMCIQKAVSVSTLMCQQLGVKVCMVCGKVLVWFPREKCWHSDGRPSTAAKKNTYPYVLLLSTGNHKLMRHDEEMCRALTAHGREIRLARQA
eukprot:418702-Pelagomonas_calceolata.AAC.8